MPRVRATVPADLAAALAVNPPARQAWDSFPRLANSPYLLWSAQAS